MLKSINHDWSKLPTCGVVDANIVEYQEAEVRILVVTWNMQGASALNEDVQETLAQLLNRSGKFDIVVVGLQEIIELKVDSLFKMFGLGNRANEWAEVLQRLTGKAHCQKHTMLSIGLFFLTDVPIKTRFYSVPTAALGLIGTKGAVACFVYLDNGNGPTATLCFINSHLSSAETQESIEDRRLEAIEIFNRGALGEPVMEHCDFVVFFGDLNLRIAPRLNADRANILALSGKTDELLKHDEFRVHQRDCVEPYCFLIEPSISFPPTYKYDGALLHQARACAYCDRVMYMRSTARVGAVDVLSYSADMTATVSDHKPVLLEVNLQVGRESEARAQTEYSNLLRKKDIAENLHRPRVFVNPTSVTIAPNWTSFCLYISGTANVSVLVAAHQKLVRVKGRPLPCSMDEETILELWSGAPSTVEFVPVCPESIGEEVIIVQAEGGNCVFVTVAITEEARESACSAHEPPRRTSLEATGEIKVGGAQHFSMCDDSDDDPTCDDYHDGLLYHDQVPTSPDVYLDGDSERHMSGDEESRQVCAREELEPMCDSTAPTEEMQFVESGAKDDEPDNLAVGNRDEMQKHADPAKRMPQSNETGSPADETSHLAMHPKGVLPDESENSAEGMYEALCTAREILAEPQKDSREGMAKLEVSANVTDVGK